MADNFYTGIAFPFQKSATSFPAEATDDELIKQEIIQLILTAKGERVMRPEVGSSINNFVFETNDDLLETNIRTVVTNTLATFEPRIIVKNVEVERASSGPDLLDQVLITITYVVPATQKTGQATVQMGLNQGPL